jgi:hypothetical protein
MRRFPFFYLFFLRFLSTNTQDASINKVPLITPPTVAAQPVGVFSSSVESIGITSFSK